MKLRGKRILAACAFLGIPTAIIGWMQYRKIEHVHRVARLSTSASFAELHRHFLFIAQSVLAVDLVVRGTIIDPVATVQATPHQTEVAHPQGWAAARVRVDQHFTARDPAGEIMLVPAGWWPTPVVGNSAQKPFAMHEEYLFFLTKDADLSRWCNTTVYAHSGQGPIPLPKAAANPPVAATDHRAEPP